MCFHSLAINLGMEFWILYKGPVFFLSQHEYMCMCLNVNTVLLSIFISVIQKENIILALEGSSFCYKTISSKK